MKRTISLLVLIAASCAAIIYSMMVQRPQEGAVALWLLSLPSMYLVLRFGVPRLLRWDTLYRPLPFDVIIGIGLLAFDLRLLFLWQYSQMLLVWDARYYWKLTLDTRD